MSRTLTETGVWCDLAQLLALRRAAGAGAALHTGTAPPGRHLQAQGAEFEEVRPYQPGEDARHIDWRVSARRGQPHTRRFRDERERPLLLLLDQRPGLFFGSRRRFKSVLAAELLALQAWAALRRQQPVGGCVLSVDGTTLCPAATGEAGVLRLLRAAAAANRTLHAAASQTSTTALEEALARWQQFGDCDLWMISDLEGFDANACDALRRLARHNRVHACLVWDALERELPARGPLLLDSGSGLHWLHCDDAALRRRYREDFDARLERLRHSLTSSGTPLLAVATDDDAVAALARGRRP